jgi:hypothetical protein
MYAVEGIQIQWTFCRSFSEHRGIDTLSVTIFFFVGILIYIIKAEAFVSLLFSQLAGLYKHFHSALNINETETETISIIDLED